MIERLLELLNLTGSSKFYSVEETYENGELKRRIVHHSENLSDAEAERMEKVREFLNEVFEGLDEHFEELRNRERRRGRKGR